MQFQITGRHVEVTPALKDMVEEKLSRFAKRHEKISLAHVVMSIEGKRQEIHVTLHMPGGEVNAQAGCEDMYKSIDLVAGKLAVQLEKHR